jgi:hypothetical protein
METLIGKILFPRQLSIVCRSTRSGPSVPNRSFVKSARVQFVSDGLEPRYRVFPDLLFKAVLPPARLWIADGQKAREKIGPFLRKKYQSRGRVRF